MVDEFVKATVTKNGKLGSLELQIHHKYHNTINTIDSESFIP